jgi:hypothetical protein
MNMFAPRIWGFDRDDAEMRMALAADWSRADLVWERLTEAAIAAFSTGDLRRTGRLLLGADLVARLFFDAHDLRRANTFANRSFLARRQGRMARAEAFQKRALTLWTGASDSIERLEFRPRSRSSLFHLRMEALHRDQFHANMRTRYRRMAAETEQVLRAAASGDRPMFVRWRGEKPPVFDDSRKFLAAALALIDG